MSWGNLLVNALKVGIAIKSISDIDEWIDEKIEEMKYKQTYKSALVEAAYEIAKMDNQAWTYLVSHLNVKRMRSDRANNFYNYCNYVVNLENNQIKSLLGYNIRESAQLLQSSLYDMATYEEAAYYGILKAYAEKDFKAQTLLRGCSRLIG